MCLKFVWKSSYFYVIKNKRTEQIPESKYTLQYKVCMCMCMEYFVWPRFETSSIFLYVFVSMGSTLLQIHNTFLQFTKSFNMQKVSFFEFAKQKVAMKITKAPERRGRDQAIK